MAAPSRNAVRERQGLLDVLRGAGFRLQLGTLAGLESGRSGQLVAEP